MTCKLIEAKSPDSLATGQPRRMGNSLRQFDRSLLPHGEFLLVFTFALFLLCFAGRTRLRAALSFVLAILVLWKVPIPSYLKGYDPILSGFAVATLHTVMIIALVYGFDHRPVSAVGGGILGLGLATILSVVCTRLFKLHGTIMPHSKSLLLRTCHHLTTHRASVRFGTTNRRRETLVYSRMRV